MNHLRHLRIELDTVGLRGMVAVAARHRLGRCLGAYGLCRPLAEEARGLEIGGPSAIFARDGLLPLYPLLARLDNCDFAGETIWHGDAAAGSPFTYDADREPGTRFVLDATALHGIGAASYDIVLASHTIEHVANPLRALGEWSRVVGSEGHLVLVVPHFENTFDHRRPVTTLEHLEDDFASAVSEEDDTHIRESIELCDLARLPERLSHNDFERRTRAHVRNRTLHHHVFDTELVVRLLDRAGYQLLTVETALPFHIVAVARAGASGSDNGAFIADTARWRRTSAFRHDRASLPRGARNQPVKQS